MTEQSIPDPTGLHPPTAQSSPIDWDLLRQAAIRAADRAYAPYSNFHVGAAAITANGHMVTGCNVENVSYGLSLCAECSLVSDLRRVGGGKLLAVMIISGSGQPCMPCGRCRQILFEHGVPECLVDGDGTPRLLADLLPGGFDSERLAQG